MSSHGEAPKVKNLTGITLYGDSPTARRISAEILVKAAKRRGEQPDEWLVSVAAGDTPT